MSALCFRVAGEERMEADQKDQRKVVFLNLVFFSFYLLLEGEYSILLW